MAQSRVDIREELTPAQPYSLPRGSADGTLQRDRNVLRRALEINGFAVLLRAAAMPDGQLVIGALIDQVAPGEHHREAEHAARRALWFWRRALGCDLDVSGFISAHRNDQLIGPSILKQPWLRPFARPSAFEALLCAITEQLIAYEDAVRIQRRIAWRFGTYHEQWDLRTLPTAVGVASLVPAQLETCGLAPARAVALHRAANEIVSGRIDFEKEPETGLQRLAQIPEIGPWTVSLVASGGLGRVDLPPSGDLGLRKAIGRVLTGDPRARVDTSEVDRVLARYAPWGTLAAQHLLQSPPVAKDPLRIEAMPPLSVVARRVA